MTTPALLPCPFCGGNDLSFRTEMEGDDYRTVIECTDYVVCGNCGAKGPPVSSTEMLWEETAAAAAWNQRSAWQPIETAPRDGTKILAWDGDEPQIVWWCDGGRWISDYLQEYHPGEREYPTYWQPLPSPPPITPFTPRTGNTVQDARKSSCGG